MTATSPSAARASLGRSPRSLSTWLDSVTARVTMYRLVLIALLVVVAAALVTSAAGLIAYEPLAILANGAAVVVATLVSNRLFALVFRVRPHTESSLVTALILLLLFQPSLTTLSVGAVALAGVIASASKYLLAVRGRHVVNPAAFAAVVISVALPAAFPGWWVGAPALLPVVLVAALVILHRTRKLPLGAVFVVVATVGVALAGLSFGSSLSAALSAAVLSSPIVFFAGFMLTEPLTLPPRRWQQLALAVVVGVLFAVPFHFGPLYGTYELALVIGNILSFAVGQRRGVRLEFVERRRLSPSSWELSRLGPSTSPPCRSEPRRGGSSRRAGRRRLHAGRPHGGGIRILGTLCRHDARGRKPSHRRHRPCLDEVGLTSRLGVLVCHGVEGRIGVVRPPRDRRQRRPDRRGLVAGDRREGDGSDGGDRYSRGVDPGRVDHRDGQHRAARDASLRIARAPRRRCRLRI